MAVDKAVDSGALDTLFENIGNAIREKDGTTALITPGNMPAKIRAIQTGVDTSDATAAASDIAKGKTAYVKGAKVTGNVNTVASGGYKQFIPKNNSVAQSGDDALVVIAPVSSAVLFRAGSKIRSLAKLSDLGNATAGEILNGKTCTSAAGLNIAGTMPNQGGKTINIASKETPVTIPQGYHDGSGKAQIDPTEAAKIIANNIRQGITILGVAGSMIGTEGAPGVPGDITFYDYDGTIVTSWTLAELATKTALPDYPSHEGLTCQGWNWSLADLKTTNRKMNVGAMYITDDGKTRIYIRLEEGRTSPMLGVCPNGTVTVDWGDGTTPDTLTGTSTTNVKWTPHHAYAAPGEYVIKLTVNGTMGFYGSNSNGGSAFLRYSSIQDNRNSVYRNSVQKIEIGNGVTSIGAYAFYNCSSLASITIPDSVTSIGVYAFYYCRSLSSITIPNASIGAYVFYNCSSLSSITIPDGVTSIESYAVYNCSSLASITIPDSVTSIEGSAFYYCSSLSSITMPNGVTSIKANTFYNCYSVAFYDFTACTTVPTLSNKNAFTGIPADCQIRVPASLVDAWKAATNWSTYADHIVGV